MKEYREVKNLTPEEIISMAVKSEVEAADYYSHLKQLIRNQLLLKKIEFLVMEEKKHKELLERFFTRKFPESPLKLPGESFLAYGQAKIDDQSSVKDLFKIALEAEKSAEEFYHKASEKVAGVQSNKIFRYLTRVERSHYYIIKSEMDLLEKFPDYYNVEEFHFGEEFVHIGP